MINKIKQLFCKHCFKVKDFKPRDKDGFVEWDCSKCGKVFKDEYGLKILENGKCDGKWGRQND